MKLVGIMVLEWVLSSSSSRVQCHNSRTYPVEDILLTVVGIAMLLMRITWPLILAEY